MRFVGPAVMTTLLMAGGVALMAAPASADDNIYFNHAKGTMSGAAPAAETSTNTTPHQAYLPEDPRDMTVSKATRQDVDANNPYFNHAEGTMSADPNASYAATGVDQNGRYTASYQQYMPMDPRDMKVNPSANQDVDGSNIYFNHAKGTMSGN